MKVKYSWVIYIVCMLKSQDQEWRVSNMPQYFGLSCHSYIGDVMVSVSPRVWQIVGSIPDRVKPKTRKRYLLILREARSIKENEQRLVGSESG
jgi:hypothetical protein